MVVSQDRGGGIYDPEVPGKTAEKKPMSDKIGHARTKTDTGRRDEYSTAPLERTLVKELGKLTP